MNVGSPGLVMMTACFTAILSTAMLAAGYANLALLVFIVGFVTAVVSMQYAEMNHQESERVRE